MDTNSSLPARIFGADLIRATAISCVIVSHLLPGSSIAPLRALRGLLGYVGVELFFVLSGYLIGTILLKSLFRGRLESLSDLGVFWKRRWMRTLPNYYLFLLLNLGLTRYLEGTLPAATGKFFWFGQGLLGEHPKFFTIAWSLAVEEWFYFCFPLLLWFVLKASRRRELAFWSSVMVFLIGPFVLRWLATGDDWDNGLRKVTFLRLDAIMFGVVLAYLRERLPAGWAALRSFWPVGALGTLSLAIYLLTHHPSMNSLFDRVLLFTVTSLSLALLFPAVLEMSTPRGLVAEPVRRVSLWSYSLYLSHAWIALLINNLMSGVGISVHGLNAALVSTFELVATLAVSAWLYARYEKPLMELRDYSFKSVPTPR